MALTGSSTFAETETEYKATASYRITESASEARRHSVSIRFLLLLLPSRAQKGSNQVGYDMDLLRDELRAADEYAKVVDGGRTNKNNIVRADFRGMRRHG